MLGLFFGSTVSILTTAFVLINISLIAVTLIKRRKIDKWGRLIMVFILLGTAISGLSATRDAFMMENALFSLNSIQSVICSAAGGLVFLIGLITIFIRKQKFRKSGFYIISLLFLIQVITVEASRISLL